MLVLGHRGAIYDHGMAQNSLRAFQEALTFADGFETDACLDKKGEVFLIHEAKYVDPEKGVDYCLGDYLDPASAARLGARRIDQLTTEDVRALRLKDGQGLPTLQDAINLVGAHKGKCLNIELKAFGVVDPVLALLQHNIRHRVIAPDALMLSSFNHPALRVVRQQMPKIKVGAIFVGADQPTTPLFPWHPDSRAAYTALTAEELQNPVLQQVNPDVIVMPQEILTEDTARMIDACYPDAKLAGWVFTEKGNLDLPDLLGRLKKLEASAKVAAIMADNPRALKAALLSAMG